MRGRISIAAIAVASLLAATVPGSAATEPALVAKKAKKCKGSVNLPGFGVAKKIRVRNISCANGKAVIRDPVGKGFDCPTGGPGAHGGTVKRCYKGHKQVKFLIV
jgi:hypothetical protein